MGPFNDLGNSPELLTAFDVLTTVRKAPPGTRTFAARRAAMTLFQEAADRDRGDLAHAQPGDLMPDTVGKGEAESSLMRRAASITVL